MKKTAIVVALLTFVMGGAALAQDPGNPYANNIGIFLNEAPTGHCGAIGANIPFTVYVILTDLSATEVHGWEAKFIFENILLLGEVIAGDNVNAGNIAGEYIVGLASPLPAPGGQVTVMEMTLMVNEFLNDITQPSNIYIEGVFFSTLPTRQPAYLPDNEGGVIGLYQAVGTEDDAQLSMNCGCDPVATEDQTWGSLKSLYR